MFMMFTKPGRRTTVVVNVLQVRYVHINERNETELVFETFQLSVAEGYDQVIDKLKSIKPEVTIR